MAHSARAVFGFSIDSSLPLTFVRTGDGREVLRVDDAPSASLAQQGTPVFQWKYKDAAGDITGAVHFANDVYHFWAADAGWFRIDPVARHITIPSETDAPRRELRLWGVPTTLCSVERGDVSLHAAAVEVDGSAVLLAAPGQHGKTTLALAFHTAGYRVLSEDVSCCRFGSTPLLYPGPASLRVRPDMYGGAPPAGTEIVATYPDRIFIRPDADRVGSADPVPLRAIFFLRQSPDQIRFERVEAARSLPDLWALSFRVPGRMSTGESFERVGRLAASVMIYNLYRPLRLDNLSTVVDRIVGAPFLRAG